MWSSISENFFLTSVFTLSAPLLSNVNLCLIRIPKNSHCQTLIKSVKWNECGYPTGSVAVWAPDLVQAHSHYSANGLGHQEMKGGILNRQTKDRQEDIIMMLISAHSSPLNTSFNGCRTTESLSWETQLLTIIGQSHTRAHAVNEKTKWFERKGTWNRSI